MKVRASRRALSHQSSQFFGFRCAGVVEQCVFNSFRDRVRGNNLISSAELLPLIDATAAIKVMSFHCPLNQVYSNFCGVVKKWGLLQLPQRHQQQKANQKINNDQRQEE